MEINSAGDDFSRFDLVTDHSDHHFRQTNTGRGDCFTNASSSVYKKIMHDWKILAKHLPPTISVRVYEQRIDLLRAVIVGAAGTPYHDGLFFFDFLFPSDYPNRPPQVHYHSFGYRLNPNLYASGKVCLSLLNTWSGRHKHEKWDPSKSTVLQILVSIQGLVLNERPYFNEPAYRGFAGMKAYEKTSRKYNMNVFVLSCNTMMHVMSKKPKNFEELVTAHFKSRGKLVLAACRAYRNGETRVGGQEYYAGGSSSSSKLLTKEMKQSLETAYPKLVTYFNWIGATLEDVDKVLIIKPVKTTTTTTTTLDNAASSNRCKKNGIVGKLIKQIKKIVGFKEKKTMD